MNTQNQENKAIVNELVKIFSKYATVMAKEFCQNGYGLLTYNTKSKIPSLAIIYINGGELGIIVKHENAVSCEISNPKCFSILEKKIKCLLNKS